MTTSPTVLTSSGPVRGERRESGMRFLGIPYAAPPVGELRFAAPVPPEPWTEVMDATAYGPTAQRRPFGEVTTIPEPTVPGESILNLNVFTPDVASPAGSGLPVLVWIHGGGYVAGSAASPWYDGAAFNRDGVIVVSLGYRLGIEGFLHLADAPDNRGVLDWIAALQWVRDNIAAFGGDPSKVTVAGQSAGGGAVQTLLATPAAQGLFRGAISVSGAVMQPQGRDMALTISRLFTERTGVPATAAALRDKSDDEHLALMDALNAPGPERQSLPLVALAPFADGDLIPVPVMDALTTGDAGTGTPLMLGFTSHEFNLMPAPDGGEETLRAALAAMGLDPDRTQRFLDLNKDTPGALLGQAATDTTFRAPSLAIAEARAARQLPTWLYQFNYTSTAVTYAGLASHCLDLPFAFGLPADAEGVTAALGENPPQRLTDVMHSAWVAFVTDLDPGAGWPRYTTSQRSTMIWDAEPHAESDPLGPVREIWLG
ncbi:carboxylesterase family protein [Streptomyces sp. NBC_00257]|uniref:carboxylesterase/lipase family protein n=1 Tax=unclassified Streptomyces TaxID=2593676 RepID=UPI0022523DCB|nr:MULTISPECIES: carboxylesterase family protein [unclassified Streptomyces]WTB59267.1 carboxylesterase family protein [Streptomyces sp. NBC_00826]WTH87861.1 carboxylesterase family protein [Streptomyces sp. NBC_00825]WTH96589.1 carboxylesterase family protein [Streptomyces sp. NBC_00822]MCX4870057.1 carboxylesterase family protein [Streptomyces sp. NBC_00906]MCX4901220.1 carboxylesterase family protein [Streptomyces sp. NBC_00892]